jgi:hypothetical protein
MMDLSLNHEPSKASLNNLAEPSRPEAVMPPHQATGVMLETLVMNPTLRKQFAHYAMTGNVVNLVRITRTNFIKFVKDCKLDLLPTPPLKDVDITNIFAAATGTGKAMDFAQLLSACSLIFKRASHLQVRGL